MNPLLTLFNGGGNPANNVMLLALLEQEGFHADGPSAESEETE